MKRVLVTGGAGFVGVNLIEHLSACGGYEITVLDNESLGNRRHLERFEVRFICGDMRSENDLDVALKGQDVVVHLAADTRVLDSISDPQHNFEVNTAGSFRLLQACRRCGVENVVAASTGGAIIGKAPAPVHEEMVARPLAPYGAAKLAMEGYMSAFAGAYGLRCCALRFSNVYGPGSFHKGSVVAHFFKELLQDNHLTVHGDGSQVRDFLYVDDLVHGIRQAIETEVSGVYQLGSGCPTTINELVSEICCVTGVERLPVRYAEFRPGEIHTTWCDISKARRDLGFEPSIPLRNGLEETWAWFNAYWIQVRGSSAEPLADERYTDLV